LRALPDSLRAAAAHGFEIANHTWEHRMPAEPDLEWDHLERATLALAAVSAAT
jgi:peptidoglycan-N-acetylglucosamine deacetylase